MRWLWKPAQLKLLAFLNLKGVTFKPAMSIYICPKGHVSSEPDYCSECGVKIQGIPDRELVRTTAAPSSKGAIACPDCTAPHEPDSGDFCEICGYNFVTGAHGELPIAKPTSEANLNQNSTIETSPKTAVALQLFATIDPSLQTPESPPAPSDQPPIIFELDRESNLIGRTSDRRGIYPEIALDFDEAVSHRHALILRQVDGTFLLRDIGSTNGITLNGIELQPMVDVPLKEGDSFTLGHWTRITVQQKLPEKFTR